MEFAHHKYLKHLKKNRKFVFVEKFSFELLKFLTLVGAKLKKRSLKEIKKKLKEI